MAESELKIADPELQKWFEDNGVTWKIEEDQESEFPLVRVSLPTPSDLVSRKVECANCGKEASVVLNNEDWFFSDSQVRLRVENIMDYQVADECPEIEKGGVSWEEIQQRYLAKDPEATKFIEGCIQHCRVREIDSRFNVNRVRSSMHELLKNTVATPEPPSALKVKTALLG